jgi:hypothetical protein
MGMWMKLTHVIHVGQMPAVPPADGAVPLVVVPAVVVHPDINAVLTVCGLVNVADRTLIINNEGFQPLVDFGILEDWDVFEMVKCLGGHTMVAGHVNVGAIQVKKLQVQYVLS